MSIFTKVITDEAKKTEDAKNSGFVNEDDIDWECIQLTKQDKSYIIW